MGDGQYPNFLGNDGIDDCKWEMLDNQPPFAMKPQRAKQGMLKQQMDRVLDLGEKSLRKSSTRSLSVVLGRLPKIGLCLGVQRVVH